MAMGLHTEDIYIFKYISRSRKLFLSAKSSSRVCVQTHMYTLMFLTLLLGTFSLGAQNTLKGPHFHWLELSVYLHKPACIRIWPWKAFFSPVIHNKSSIWGIFRHAPTWLRSSVYWKKTLMERVFFPPSVICGSAKIIIKREVCELMLLLGKFHFKKVMKKFQ